MSLVHWRKGSLSLPEEIWNQSQLERLGLGNNQLRSLPERNKVDLVARLGKTL